MKSDEKPNSWERVMRILGGFEIAVICLVLLFIHTFYSTLEQQWLGLYGTIQKYFDLESLWVIPTNRHDKAICIPLPGAYWVMALLTLNMTIGGIIRMKKGWKKLGILISHFSIVFMMIAGGVSSLSKIEGNMIVVEGQKSDFAMKSHAPSIELAKYGEDGLREEPLVVPPESLQELEPSDTLTANFSDLACDENHRFPRGEQSLGSRQETKRSMRMIRPLMVFSFAKPSGTNPTSWPTWQVPMPRLKIPKET